jgi:hypothetical protein
MVVRIGSSLGCHYPIGDSVALVAVTVPDSTL